jgi:hypothetical protein
MDSSAMAERAPEKWSDVNPLRSSLRPREREMHGEIAVRDHANAHAHGPCPLPLLIVADVLPDIAGFLRRQMPVTGLGRYASHTMHHRE